MMYMYSNVIVGITISRGSIVFSQYVELTSHVKQTRFITSSTGKHYSLDSEDDFHSGCRNVSHQQQFFSKLPYFLLLFIPFILSKKYYRHPDDHMTTYNPGFKPFKNKFIQYSCYIVVDCIHSSHYPLNRVALV